MSDDPRYKITVEVVTEYIPEQSHVAKKRFVYSYHITITNIGTLGATLQSRRWLITDGDGKTQEVSGAGVVGEQPHLAPGQSFQYSSGTVIKSHVGSMRGCYSMSADDGTDFEATIEPFTLSTPHALH